MAKKQELKMSEAKIIIYLKNVEDTKKHAFNIVEKLFVDYGYLLRILQGMVSKGWLRKIVSGTNVVYELTSFAPYDKAVKLVAPAQAVLKC